MLPALAALAASSAALAAASRAQSAAALFAAGTFATATAWTLSGQVTPCAREMSAAGEEGRAMGVVVSAWAAGALGGAQLHGALAEVSGSRMPGRRLRFVLATPWAGGPPTVL